MFWPFNKREERGADALATTTRPTGWLLDAFGNSSVSGALVSSETAQNVAAVYACVQVISESLASLPLKLYRRRPNGSRELATDHPLSTLFRCVPNSLQDAFQFREMMQASTLLRGVAYAEIVSNAAGEITALNSINPDWVVVRREGNAVNYDVSVIGGGRRTIRAENMFTLLDRVDDAACPKSRIARTRDSIGAAITSQNFAASFFGSASRPSGVLIYPGRLSDEGKQNLKDSWNKAHSGASRAGSTAVLEEACEWKPLGITPEDSELLGSRKFGVTEICRIFRVPPPLIADLEKASYANVEELHRQFAKLTLGPWCARWENALERQLLTEGERAAGFYFEHNLDSLLRGDTTARYQAYAVGRQNGWLSVNEIRSLENLDPIADGDKYLEPMNMQPATPAAASPSGTRDNVTPMRAAE